MEEQRAEESLTGEMEAEGYEAGDIDSLKRALAEAEAKVEANLAGWQRAQADFVNYKRRSEQEREEVSKSASSVLMLQLLPVLDDLERAFDAIPHRLAKHDWVDGIRLIERKLKLALEAQGLSDIKAMGEPFDPSLHEAVMQGKGEENIVVGEIQKGYMLHDRVIRPSRVIVGNGEAEKEE